MLSGGLRAVPGGTVRHQRLVLAPRAAPGRQEAGVSVEPPAAGRLAQAPPASAAKAQRVQVVDPEESAVGDLPGAAEPVAPPHQNGSAAPAAAPGGGGHAPAAPGGGGWLTPVLVGELCLLGVAALKGSYSPFLRLLYSQDGPPEPVAIMLFRGVLQAMVLVTAYSIFGSKGQPAAGGGGGSSSSSSSSSSEATAAGSSNGSAAGGRAAGGSAAGGAAPSFGAALLQRVPFTAIASVELGLWLFMATGIQTLGLQLTTATRAGFLIQSTALMTPLLASFTGQKPSRNVWIGCVIALAGCLAIAADQASLDGDEAAVFSLGGDAAILSSAFFFSLATVRLGTYARLIPAVELAAGKSVVLGTAALITFCAAAASMTAAGDPLTDLWPGYASGWLSWAIVCYAALGPGALAAFLHAKGQSVVPPAEAQVIFSTMPLWSIAFAFLLLGGEPLTATTLAGGAAVVAAGFVASRKDGSDASGDGGGSTSKHDKQG